MGSKAMAIIVLALLISSGCLPASSSTEDRTWEGSWEDASSGSGGLGIKELVGQTEPLIPPKGHFTRNDGQLDRQSVRFYTLDPIVVGFTDRGLLIDVRGPSLPAADAGVPMCPPRRACDWTDIAVKGVMVELLFAGGDPRTPRGLEPTAHTSNFFLGNDPASWVTRVPSFRRVLYEDVWDNIDIEYLCGGGGVKYNIHVRPGGDVEDVRFEYRGLDRLQVDDHRLVLSTGAGEIVDSELLIYQETEDGISEVPGRFVSTGPSSIGFRMEGDYLQDRDLVIDPNLTYSTYMGSRNTDWCEDMAVGPDDTVYLVGTTNSFHFPVTPGAYQQQNNRGRDAFVVRMNSNGTDLVFSTYLGGSWRDNCTAIEVDADGNAYIVGDTDSNDFPVTSGAMDTSFNGVTDGVVLKLNSTGDKLLFSSFFGGAGTEWPLDVAIDGSKNLYLTGYVTDLSASTDFPTTSGAFCETYSGIEEVFVAKVKSDGSELLYSTLIGGVEDEYSYAIAADVDGNAYITGYTWGNDFPVTEGAYKTDNYMEIYDLFITKFNPSGTALVWSTFLGGWLYEFGYDIQVDDDGEVYVTGVTTSDDFPITAGAYNSTYDNGLNLFITKLKADGSALNFSTFVGDAGGGYDDFTKIAVGPDRSVYFATDVDNWQAFPTTEGAYDTTSSDWADIAFGRVSADGTELLYSSFLGGGGDEHLKGMAVDGSGNIYFSGEVNADDFPTTRGAYSEGYVGETDSFVVKADIVPPEVLQNLTPASGTTNDPFTFSARVRDNVGLASVDVVYWFGDDDEVRKAMVESSTEEGLFNLTLTDTPLASPLHYYLNISDRAGNVVITPRTNVTLRDNTGPTFGHDTTPPTATTGDELMFEVAVTDNVGLDEVRVIYEIGTRGDQNLSMGAEAPFRRSVTIPGDAFEPLRYFFSSSDTSHNWNSTTVRTVTILDDDLPVFMGDLSDDAATTGDVFRFRAQWMDNIEVESANVVYWYGDDGSSPFNVTMPRFGLTEYLLDSVIVPSSSLQPLSYYFAAVDGSGNFNRTTVRTIDVADNDPPGIVDDRTDMEATTGDVFTVTVDVVDNIGVEACVLHYWFDDASPQELTMEGRDLSGMGNGTYSSTIDVPSSAAGVLHYYLELVDILSNVATTETVSLDVMDNDPPRIGTDSTPEEGVKGHPFTFEVVISDNIGITSAHVEVDVGAGAPLNVSMASEGFVWTATITVERQTGATMRYRFSAVDSTGNWASTPEWGIVRLVSPPPVVGTIPVWSVQEGVPTTLDLGPYLSDDNDPVETLVVTCSDPNVTVDGHNITALFDVWLAELTIEVRVSDGESEVPADIDIVMVDVNDPPGIPMIVTPVNGTKVRQGKPVTFEGTFDDPDLPEGQVLVVEWTSSIDGTLGTFSTDTGVTPLVLSDLGPGRHKIILTVSDGRYTSSTWVTLEVKEDVSAQSSSLMVAILLIAVLVVVAVVFLFLKLRPQPQDEMPTEEPLEEPTEEPLDVPFEGRSGE